MSCICGSNSPLSFTKRVPICTTAALQLGKDYGSHHVKFSGEGFFVFSFESIAVSDLMNIKLIDGEITYTEFELPVGALTPLKVGPLTVDRQDFDFSASRGHYSPSTGELELWISLRLDHERFRAIADALNIRAPVVVHIREKGKLDLKTGAFETNAAEIRLDHYPQLLSYRNSKKHCHATPHLTVGVGSLLNNGDTPVSQVWICPKHTAVIGWQVDGRPITRATLSDGTDVLAQLPRGSKPLKPSTTTTFTLLIDTDNCSDVKSETVTIFVVEPGMLFQLTAQPLRNTWHAEILPQVFDPSVMCTSIQLVECLSNNVISNLKVEGIKRDTNGISHNFNVADGKSSQVNFPIVGSWDMTVPGIDIATADMCLNLTMAC